MISIHEIAKQYKIRPFKKRIDTVQQMQLRDVPRGEFLRRKLDAKKTYTRGDYDRSSRTYSLDDWDDISRAVYLKGATLVWVGFDF